jgi:hypothetical protein
MIAMSQKSGLTLIVGFQVIFYHYQLQSNLMWFFHYQTLPNFLCYPDSDGGVAAEIPDHIIEPFFIMKSKEKGCGLGLDIARKIIKIQKIFKVYNQLSKTTFIVLLPLTKMK